MIRDYLDELRELLEILEERDLEDLEDSEVAQWLGLGQRLEQVLLREITRRLEERP